MNSQPNLNDLINSFIPNNSTSNFNINNDDPQLIQESLYYDIDSCIDKLKVKHGADKFNIINLNCDSLTLSGRSP